MSSSARLEVPGTGDDGKVPVYDESEDKWVVSALVAGGGSIISISGTNLAALEAAVAAASTGDTVRGTPGTTYTHADVWVIDQAGITIDFTGCIIVASDETQSAIQIVADDVTLIGGTYQVTTTVRGNTLEHQRIVLDGCSGGTVRNVRIEGSHAGGIFTYGASDFLIEDCTVLDTRADGIHITATSVRGKVLRARCYRTGDDGVAVVSYEGDVTACEEIEIIDAVVWDQVSGRGVTVVGGTGVRIVNPDVRRSFGAGLYLANESGDFDSLPTTDVLIDGGRLTACNYDASLDHGALFVYTGIDGEAVSGVSVRGLEIVDSGLSPSLTAVQVKDGGSTGTTSSVVLGTSDAPIRLTGLYYGSINVDGGLTVSSNVERAANSLPPDWLLWGGKSWDTGGSISNGSSVTTTVTVDGAALGDPVVGCALSTIDEGGWAWRADVTAADTVTVVLVNNTGGGIDLATGDLTVQVLKA